MKRPPTSELQFFVTALAVGNVDDEEADRLVKVIQQFIRNEPFKITGNKKKRTIVLNV